MLKVLEMRPEMPEALQELESRGISFP